MEKINIAELLKDCPSGMELDCTIWNNEVKVFLKEVRNADFTYPIVVTIKDNNIEYSHSFTKYGAYNDYPYCKCVIFPKGKTTWERFVPPCKFKEGDVVISVFGDIHLLRTEDSSYCAYRERWNGLSNLDKTTTTGVRVVRLATEEEKAKLFQAIKKNGYKWNPETKTLEKLVEPKFKVGDRIQSKNFIAERTIKRCEEDGYCTTVDSWIRISDQDNWELVPDKFDINTLVSFESRVLVRSTDDDKWRPAIYGFTDSDRYYVVGGIYWKQCIPYEGNEHLRGTTNDCDEYYKTWE